MNNDRLGSMLVVTNFPTSMSEINLKEMFSTCGDILGVDIYQTKFGENVAFLQFAKRCYLESAVLMFDKKKVDTRYIKVTPFIDSEHRYLFLEQNMCHKRINYEEYNECVFTTSGCTYYVFPRRLALEEENRVFHQHIGRPKTPPKRPQIVKPKPPPVEDEIKKDINTNETVGPYNNVKLNFEDDRGFQQSKNQRFLREKYREKYDRRR